MNNDTHNQHGSAKRLAIGVMLGAALMWTGANAQEVEDRFEVVESKLRTLAPGAASIAISDSPVEGVLQAQINNEIVYISADGAYMLQGTLYDIDNRINLTDQAKSGLRRELMSNQDDRQEIKFSPVEPAYSLTVFTDIDCGYCRKLHDQIDEYMEEGIEISYMAFPRAGIGSHSYEKFVSVWCAADQQAALTLAKSGEEPEPKQCDNPIEDQYNLGQEVGVTGTPALLTTNGDLIPGYMPPAQLRARLEQLTSQSAPAP